MIHNKNTSGSGQDMPEPLTSTIQRMVREAINEECATLFESWRQEANKRLEEALTHNPYIDRAAVKILRDEFSLKKDPNPVAHPTAKHFLTLAQRAVVEYWRRTHGTVPILLFESKSYSIKCSELPALLEKFAADERDRWLATKDPSPLATRESARSHTDPVFPKLTPQEKEALDFPEED